MPKYAILENNVIVNVIEWDGDKPYTTTAQQTVVEYTEGDIGWKKNGKKFVEIQAVDTRSAKQKRKAEYPSIEDQLDMLHADMVAGTTVWKDTISAIKVKYPSEIK